MKRIKKIVAFSIALAALSIGFFLFEEQKYTWGSLVIAIMACLPFFVKYENGRNAAEIVVIAIMTSIAVLGRIIFVAVPGFKPVTAVVVITAMYFGAHAGFITGALAALVSNFYFGQGPWTPIQMLVWGLIGLLSGIIALPLKKSLVLRVLFGAFSGVLYTLIIELWTVIWLDGYFNIRRYLTLLVSSGWFTLMYLVSNVVFLLLLAKPIGKKLERIITKYGL
ncbi:MAG TPA: ECF transporter S component [Clostridiales bacterium]|nr:ECF transporter S component [Clostridiales bacterium]